LSVNPADKAHVDLFDEEVEKMLFQDAVKEWRQGGEKGKLTIVREYQQGGGGKGSKAGKISSSTETITADMEPVKSSTTKQEKVENDTLDEEAERRAFQEAVAEWRQGNKTTTNSSSSNSKAISSPKKVSVVHENPQQPQQQYTIAQPPPEEQDHSLWKNPFADIPSKPVGLCDFCEPIFL
jgi:nitrogen fixation/metabolism regulation signal transduction histidine kinase